MPILHLMVLVVPLALVVGVVALIAVKVARRTSQSTPPVPPYGQPPQYGPPPQYRPPQQYGPPPQYGPHQ
ncbi:MAG TPA: hypothetical protein VGL93_35035 [Streptosporangiaceae bacterium]|jgi:hypothetical protein